jgi:hypothetical protein
MSHKTGNTGCTMHDTNRMHEMIVISHSTAQHSMMTHSWPMHTPVCDVRACVREWMNASARAWGLHVREEADCVHTIITCVHTRIRRDIKSICGRRINTIAHNTMRHESWCDGREGLTHRIQPAVAAVVADRDPCRWMTINQSINQSINRSNASKLQLNDLFVMVMDRNRSIRVIKTFVRSFVR